MSSTIKASSGDQSIDAASVHLEPEVVHVTEPQEGNFFGISIRPVANGVSWLMSKASEKFSAISSWATSSPSTERQDVGRSSMDSSGSYDFIEKDDAGNDPRISRRTGDLEEASAAPSVAAGTGYAGFFKSIGKVLAGWSDWLNKGQVFGNSGTKGFSTEQVKNILSDREHRSGLFFTTETVSLEEMGAHVMSVSDVEASSAIPKGYAEVLSKERRDALKTVFQKEDNYDETTMLSGATTSFPGTSWPTNKLLACYLAKEISWTLIEVTIQGEKLDLSDTSLSPEAKLKKFQQAFAINGKAPLSDREAFELLRLIGPQGRTSGFPSGINPSTGICLAELEGGGPPKIDITPNDHNGWDIDYITPQTQLKNITIPGVTINDQISYDFQANDYKSKFQTTRQYTCSYQPPADPTNPDSKGDFEYTYSAQAYWLEEPADVSGGDDTEVEGWTEVGDDITLQEAQRAQASKIYTSLQALECDTTAISESLKKFPPYEQLSHFNQIIVEAKELALTQGKHEKAQLLTSAISNIKKVLQVHQDLQDALILFNKAKYHLEQFSLNNDDASGYLEAANGNFLMAEELVKEAKNALSDKVTKIIDLVTRRVTLMERLKELAEARSSKMDMGNIGENGQANKKLDQIDAALKALQITNAAGTETAEGSV